jgi:hypothetical protein
VSIVVQAGQTRSQIINKTAVPTSIVSPTKHKNTILVSVKAQYLTNEK